MSTKLFLDTTNPQLSWRDFIKLTPVICLSILLNTVVYTIFLNLASYVFVNRILSKEINIRLVVALIVIMFIGYIGRFFHCKEAYKVFNYNKNTTREYINTHYNSWIFLG